MPASWHGEALKSQAVAARTYALYQGFGFQVAQVVDTTLSQAYGGLGAEKPATIAAVDATKGEVATFNGKVIETVFSSSAGGATADATEIWETASHISRRFRVLINLRRKGYTIGTVLC